MYNKKRNHLLSRINEGILAETIIVRMPNWIGDLVMAIPVLSSLRKAYPSAKITAMCLRNIASLLHKHPDLDEIFQFDRGEIFTRNTVKRDIVQKMRYGQYELGIVLPNSFSSAWLLWQGGVKRRVGYEGNLRNWLLTDVIPRSIQQSGHHLVTTYQLLLTSLSIHYEITSPTISLDPVEIEYAKNIFRVYGIVEHSTVLGINIGAAYGSAKCWPANKFYLLAKKLLENHPLIHLVFFGDQSLSDTVKKICSSLPKRAINLAGLTTLRELAAMISLCDGFLTNDSGPMHIADAVSTPLIAMFGSTCKDRTGPYSGGTIIHKETACSPCFSRTCPIDFRCMEKISVQEVYNACTRILQEKESRDVSLV